ncbi:CAP domain-containing protein [Thaumasiovibrio sp. DFM-14]|uniref:CAP domain-containing protein n=1 Tax=Thaumasiovibrio sp. DFM-14 TaxID=3384792 RepID=UPI0039A29B8F
MKWTVLLVGISSVLVGCGSGSSAENSDLVSQDNSDAAATSPSLPSGDSVENETGSLPSSFAEQMLEAVNQARAVPQQCGDTIMPAVDPLSWDYDLESAAYAHSSDMANGDFMSHTGSDGSSMTDRVNRTGYAWQALGENVAAGQSSVERVMSSWMNSEGHCKNIMSEDFTQIGAALVENNATTYTYYWTQVFARGR